VRARGKARVLTLDKRNFLRRINEDPSLAFRIIETMAHRVRLLSDGLVEARRALAAREGGER
jgi:CRP-like cAMP-binding protein